MSKCSPGHETPQEKGKVRQRAGKDQGISRRRVVCLCRVSGVRAIAHHGGGLKETALETLFED